MRRERRVEAGDVRPARRVGHADDLRPVRAQQRPEVKVAGVVDQNRVAGIEQEAAEQVDRLRA